MTDQLAVMIDLYVVLRSTPYAVCHIEEYKQAILYIFRIVYNSNFINYKNDHLVVNSKIAARNRLVHAAHRSTNACIALERRPRCFGRPQRVGATLYQSSSSTRQRRPVIPAAIAGVRGVRPILRLV